MFDTESAHTRADGGASPPGADANTLEAPALRTCDATPAADMGRAGPGAAGPRVFVTERTAGQWSCRRVWMRCAVPGTGHGAA
eukprot:2544274-Rhodomonas_salina.1